MADSKRLKCYQQKAKTDYCLILDITKPTLPAGMSAGFGVPTSLAGTAFVSLSEKDKVRMNECNNLLFPTFLGAFVA